MEERSIYSDIAERTQGDIYIGDCVVKGLNLQTLCGVRI